MCGIIGHVELNGAVDRPLFDRMRDTLAHRGPDGAGTWMSEDGRIALGHRRLSFLDLSENGAQPMENADGSLIITLNGEVYNYIELRDELMAKGHEFRTGTDTEVLLHGHAEWGIAGLLERIKGMFAFALLDKKANRLYLVRDRFGIKPLYYHLSEESLLFASELKAIMASGLVPKKLDMGAFTDYFVYRYVPSPITIWMGVSKLPPAHFLTVDLADLSHSITEYWKLEAADGDCDPAQLAEEVGKMLRDSVSIHARSDVEVGTFLSGGYDSSAIALFHSEENPSLRSFSIGFDGWENSEHFAASTVANHLSIKNDFLLADRNSLDLLYSMARVYDEPIADISIIPTLMVSRMAAQHVKAVMSGEGADELFVGYEWQKRYAVLRLDVSSPSSAPGLTRQAPTLLLQRLKAFLGLPSPLAPRPPSPVPFYADAMSMGRFDGEMLREMLEPEHHAHIREDVDWFYRKNWRDDLSPLKAIQLMDIKCFMGELVLTKIDRASMACSLEVRVPFLNHGLYGKVFACKEENYFRPETAKFLLHENVKDGLPKEILARKKQGFVGPDSYYMDIGWYAEKLEGSRLVSDGIVRKAFVSRLLEENDHWRLWKLVVMENWYAQWI